MSLTDPTSGVGYSLGDILPSGDMTTIATQQPNALDAVNGGNYTLGSNLNVSGSGVADWDNFAGRVQNGQRLDVDAGGIVEWDGGSKTDLPRIQSRSYSFTVPLFGPVTNLQTRFSFNTTGNISDSNYHWEQQNVDSAGRLTFVFVPPMSWDTLVQLSALNITVSGGGASHGALPATMPRWRLGVKRLGDWSGTAPNHGPDATELVPWTNDNSADVSSYETPHGLPGGLGINDDPKVSGSLAEAGSYYIIDFEGETGLNAEIGGFMIGGVDAIWTTTRIGP